MRMRAHISTFARWHLHRPHMVEEDKWPDRLGRSRRQQAAHREIAQVAHMRLQQVFDSRHNSSGGMREAGKHASLPPLASSVGAGATNHSTGVQNRRAWPRSNQRCIQPRVNPTPPHSADPMRRNESIDGNYQGHWDSN
ncbi:hypothetical protein D3C81_1449490 [compost metagenome]